MKACFARIKERPILVVFIVVSTLLLCMLEQFNPITRELGSLSKLLDPGTSDYVEFLANVADKIASMATDPKLMAVTIGVAILFVFALSAIIGIFYAGYTHVLYLSLIDHAPKKGDFKAGINKNFVKITLYFVLMFALSLIFIVLVAYSIVPAAMTFKQLLAGEKGVILQMIFLTLLTAAILFFAIVFFAMYFSFILPGLVGFKRGGISVSMRMVNGYCWYLIPRTLAYLLVMAAIFFLMLVLGYGSSSTGLGIVVLILNTILKSVCNFVYIYYVFSTFIAMKEDMFTAG